MGYVAYRMPSSGKPRPVTFVWNGGPGANSALLHFSAAGPKRAAGATLVDNTDSWLDATDLVMVDPVGTGFSRPARAEYAAQFYGTRGDVASVAEFVRAWLLRHDADDAPLYLVGESWGAARAAQVAHALQARERRVDGIVLVSGGWALNAEYVPAPLRRALGVVDMAAAALFHGRTAPELGRDPAAVQRAAEAWVRETYAPALERRDTLGEAERDAIVAGLARFTGLDAARIDRRRLEISPRQFRTQLLADRGREAYVFDLRLEAPPGEPARAAILRYLRRDLGFRSELPYVGLEPLGHAYSPDGKYPESVGARWDYATADVSAEERRAAIEAAVASGSGPPRLGPPLPATLEALQQNAGAARAGRGRALRFVPALRDRRRDRAAPAGGAGGRDPLQVLSRRPRDVRGRADARRAGARPAGILRRGRRRALTALAGSMQMSLPAVARLREYLEAHAVMTLATSGPQGAAAAAVFYAAAGAGLYFLSAPGTLHARNLAADPRVAATIQDDVEDWARIQGVQLLGRAVMLDGAAASQAERCYAARFPAIFDPATRPAQIGAALARIRWYRLDVERWRLIDNSRGFGRAEEGSGEELDVAGRGAP